jgi:hypothetical protein
MTLVENERIEKCFKNIFQDAPAKYTANLICSTGKGQNISKTLRVDFAVCKSQGFSRMLQTLRISQLHRNELLCLYVTTNSIGKNGPLLDAK